MSTVLLAVCIVATIAIGLWFTYVPRPRLSPNHHHIE
jgi:hypothetical protein